MTKNKRIALVFYLLLAVYSLWVLSLPVFPSMDGPMHLYYAHVVQRLMEGSPQFGQLYFRQHVLPPESLPLYLLMYLMRIMPPFWAEKTLAVLCVVFIAFGLRFLMNSYSDQESALSVFAVPITLTWALFVGFFSYLLGLGLCMIAMGVWCRAAARHRPWLWTVVTVLSIILVLTHPVDLLLLDIFCFLELLVRAGKGIKSIRKYSAEVLTLSTMFVISLYVFLFFQPHAEKLYPHTPGTTVKFSEIISAWYITPLQAAPGIVIRFAFILLLVFALQCGAFGLGERIHRKSLQLSDLLFLCAIALLAIIPFLPFELNHAAFVGQRMVYVFWLSVLAAAGANHRILPKQHFAITVAGIVFSIGLLALIHSQVINMARVVAAAPKIPRGEEGRFGILVEISEHKPLVPSLTFDPFTFSGARSFIEGDVVLFNGPWLRAPAGLLATTNDLPDENQKDHPFNILQTLEESPALMGEVRRRVDIVMVEGAEGPNQERDNVIRTILPNAVLSCQRYHFYEVCSRTKT